MKRPLHRNVWLGVILAWASLGLAARVIAQEPAAAGRQAASSAAPAAAPADRAADERAVRAVAGAFKQAYDAGDAKAAAALFTDDAEIIDEEGERIEGRTNIEGLYAAVFQARPGAKIEIALGSLRFLGPDVAKEEGETRVIPTGKEPETVRHYTVVYVKNGGRWLHSSVREENSKSVTPHDRLKELEWLLGEWVDESSEATVHVTCRWSDDKNYLLREFLVHTDGKPVMNVTQRIGWDPLTQQIKSWVFDSEGGYGDALWSRSGNQWLIKSTGVLPEGKTASATNVLTQLSPTQARWTSSERTFGGQEVPGQIEVLMVRKPPGPRTK